MVEFISSWVEQITIAVVIASLFEMLLPKGKIKKYVKTIIGIYIIFNIISPFISNKEIMNIQNFDIKEYIDDSQLEVSAETKVDQTSMDKRLKQLYIEELEKDISKKVEENGYKVKKCNVDAVLEGSNEKTGITKVDLVVKKDNEEQKSDIQSIEKIQIDISEEKEISESKNILDLKHNLSSYYEIDEKIIKIKETN